jgi:hypothetical protein
MSNNVCLFFLIIRYNRSISDLREALAALPVEQNIGIDASKIYQQLTESFYAYECHLANFVFDRDMHNIIYSFGFVPVSILRIKN